MTWKVADGIYQHIDVREEGKENAFSLGQSLWINNEEFEDLDEIIARHIQPMAAFARDLIAFKYYRDTGGAKKETMEKLLMEEKKKQPSKIHYFISSSKVCGDLEVIAVGVSSETDTNIFSFSGFSGQVHVVVSAKGEVPS